MNKRDLGGIVKIFKEMGADEVIGFGSQFRGKPGPDSDWDIAVVGEQLSMRDRDRLIQELKDNGIDPEGLDLTVVDPYTLLDGCAGTERGLFKNIRRGVRLD